LLSIHILNVGHGDSIVIEHESEGKKSFGVVDSNAAVDEIPRALEKLTKLGADRLSFVALTHPHADHYGGLEKVLENFSGRINAFFTFPIEKQRDRLKKLAQKYQLAAQGTDSETVKGRALQFISFITHVSKSGKIWEAPTGLLGYLTVHGFSDLTIQHALPPSRVKGRYYNSIDKGVLSLEDESDNALSTALLLHYKGNTILLGGDGTEENWLHQAQRLRTQHPSMRANVVKLPHHGAKKDCSDSVLDSIFSAPNESIERIAIISANGKSHPSAQVLKSLHSRGIKPYCTTLSKHCGAKSISQLHPLGNADPALSRFLSSVASEDRRFPGSPCQGDITVLIDDNGRLSIKRQFENLCAYRNEYDHI
jgi:beta-lactamase superfamily II metal-dependent hydrolase